MAFPFLPVALGASSLGSLLSGLFGGGQKITQELSPEARAFLNQLLGEYPLEQQQALIRRAFAPQIAAQYRGLRAQTAPLGSAQQVQGRLETDQNVMNSILQAALQRQEQIGSNITGLLSGTGTRKVDTPFGTRLGEGFGDLSQIFATLIGMQEYNKILKGYEFPGIEGAKSATNFLNTPEQQYLQGQDFLSRFRIRQPQYQYQYQGI